MSQGIGGQWPTFFWPLLVGAGSHPERKGRGHISGPGTVFVSWESGTIFWCEFMSHVTFGLAFQRHCAKF